MYDVIILGGGPAGVSASLYTKRANKNVLMIYNEESGLKYAHKIDNYYGFENGISGEDLYNAGIKQAQNIGVDTAREEILKIEVEKFSKPNSDENDSLFKVITDKNNYETKTIILAFGAKKNTLKIDGIKELEGKGISYCAICDGFFYRNKDVAVIGSGNYAVSETNDLINIANKITILTNGEKAPEFRADNVDVITKNIKAISGENRVEEIQFEDDSTMKTDGVFIAARYSRCFRVCKKTRLTNKE